VDIDLKSLRFTTVPNHDSTVVSLAPNEQNKADSEPLSGRKVPTDWHSSSTQP
jgi:hypothetical protein